MGRPAQRAGWSPGQSADGAPAGWLQSRPLLSRLMAPWNRYRTDCPLTRSLAVRVLLLVAGSSLVLAALLALTAFLSWRAYWSETSYGRASAFVERILDTNPDLWAAYRADPAHASDLLRQFVLFEPDTGLYLLDTDGRVLVSAGEGRLFWSAWRVDLTPVRRALAASPNVPIRGDDPDFAGRESIVAARPIRVGEHEVGWLYVVARSADMTDMPGLVRAYAVRAAVTIALLTMGIGVALTLAIMALLTRPLSALTETADRVSHGGFADPLHGDLSALAARRDEIGRLSGAFRDMLERLRHEMERVTRTDAMRREMVASVSHDLRTPLTALIGQLDTIRLKGVELGEDERRRFFEAASRNALHLKRLTDALAELARLDDPGMRIEPEPTALGELVDDIAQRWRPQAQGSGVAVSVDYPDGLPLVPLDAALIERAVGNLLDNALRVTPAGGQIALRIEPEPQAQRLTVADTGPGVPQADREHVFDRFFQGSAHRERRGSSGLGLAIVRRVAELHGGVAGLDAEDGCGARFWIRLPLAA